MDDSSSDVVFSAEKLLVFTECSRKTTSEISLVELPKRMANGQQGASFSRNIFLGGTQLLENRGAIQMSLIWYQISSLEVP